MRRLVPIVILAAFTLSGACEPHASPDSGATDGGSDGGTTDAGIPSATGAIPEGLPRQLLVGLFENTGETWMHDSKVPFQLRYRYFVKGWSDNFGFGEHDGAFGLAFMRDCDTHGFVPVVQYYQVNGEAGGGEDEFLTKVQDPTTMAGYYDDFKLLMQRAKEFGKPVIVLLEADGFGLLQQQTASDSNAPAAVGSTSMPELANLPNTVAGWGLSFLQLRKSVGATNVILGIHISAWASGKDISYFSLTDPLQPEVDKVYSFLAPFGLADNVTGDTFDLLVGDPLDRDSDYYRLKKSEDRWWEMADDAPVESKSFNRYAEWLKLWNQTAQKRWVLWQIPIGNRFHLNVMNDGVTPHAGYRDNRVEYFFETNAKAHQRKFAESGVIGLLFGAGLDGMSSYTNDYDDVDQLYLKTHVDAFFRAGGMAIR
jgi:hypothetical protein